MAARLAARSRSPSRLRPTTSYGLVSSGSAPGRISIRACSSRAIRRRSTSSSARWSPTPDPYDVQVNTEAVSGYSAKSGRAFLSLTHRAGGWAGARLSRMAHFSRCGEEVAGSCEPPQGNVSLVRLPQIGVRVNTLPDVGYEQRSSCGSAVEVPVREEAGLKKGGNRQRSNMKGGLFVGGASVHAAS